MSSLEQANWVCPYFVRDIGTIECMDGDFPVDKCDAPEETKPEGRTEEKVSGAKGEIYLCQFRGRGVKQKECYTQIKEASK